MEAFAFVCVLVWFVGGVMGFIGALLTRNGHRSDACAAIPPAKDATI
jgi:hypothetical protein